MALASRNSKHDIIEFYGGEAWLAITMLRRRRDRPLLVSHSNGLEPHVHDLLATARGAHHPRNLFASPGLDRLYCRAFRQCDGLVTVSQFDADYALASRFVPPERLLALENPLPATYLDQPLNEDREKVIGFCGSWIPRKGISRLTRELGEVLRQHQDWQLMLVGVGGAFQAEQHFEPDIVGQILVVGNAVRDEGLRALYQRMRILVMPSLYESFGLVAAEAMACGCALVATPVGFAAALLPGEEAILVDPREGGLRDAVRSLIGNDELRRRVARGGHRRVQGLRWESAGATLMATYRAWLDEYRKER
jgi:glycosyltransferase involved in cell wall biosynthesis